MDILEKKYEQALWIAKTLYDLGKATGSSANMSFKHNEKIYVTGSGTCFGNLTKEDFSIIDAKGETCNGVKASKELMLHKYLYDECQEVSAVIHTHGFYATLWSCLKHKNTKSIVPNYTPYLKMKIGDIALVPYGKPGSQALFDSFYKEVCETKARGYILAHHGPIVGHKDLMSAYFALEELEESCHIAYELRNTMVPEIQS